MLQHYIDSMHCVLAAPIVLYLTTCRWAKAVQVVMLPRSLLAEVGYVCMAAHMQGGGSSWSSSRSQRRCIDRQRKRSPCTAADNIYRTAGKQSIPHAKVKGHWQPAGVLCVALVAPACCVTSATMFVSQLWTLCQQFVTCNLLSTKEPFK
jgi:hypothetical protein